VYMGDVHYRDKIEYNRGVVMGHAHSTATDGVRITGSTTNVSAPKQDHTKAHNKLRRIRTMALRQVAPEEPLIREWCCPVVGYSVSMLFLV
jgi:hypothetical protein